MDKIGILHDYDLMANAEPSSRGHTCLVCGVNPTIFQWSDYSGEAMCTQCGCPYQLKWGGATKEKEGKYPYLNFREDFIPIAKEYWEETKQFVCYGTVMRSPLPGVKDFNFWVKKYHPELLEGEKGGNGNDE